MPNKDLIHDCYDGHNVLVHLGHPQHLLTELSHLLVTVSRHGDHLSPAGDGLHDVRDDLIVQTTDRKSVV